MVPSSSGLGCRPLTPETRVRTPLGLFTKINRIRVLLLRVVNAGGIFAQTRGSHPCPSMPTRIYLTNHLKGGFFMSEPPKKKAAYDDLFNIPENMTGEIINGELVVTPRPSKGHGYAVTTLGHEIGPPYRFGRGGPGGWVFIFEPEIQF